MPTLTLALTNANGATTNVSAGAPATVKATLKDAAGAAVPNALVTFKITDATLATITPAATALTDPSGIASVTLNPATLTAAGATTITGTAQPTAATGSINFTVSSPTVTVSQPVLGANPLSAFGTTSITVTVSIGVVPVTTPQNVTFSSPCASSGKAVLSSGVATVNGVAVGSFRDNGCAATDAITATAAGVTSLPTNLVVTPPAAGSIQFVSATPASISLKGTGGVETAQVIFKVVDTGGNPISGKLVTFTLSTTLGGITLTPTPSTATSDANGLVVTNVNSGTVSTPVRVTATTPGATAGTTLNTQSNGLTITTGIPDQDSFSISATKLNPEFRDFDGNTTVLTVRLADHFNNPVPDGTVVNFTTEGGSIVASCSTLVDSSGNSNCSSTLTSQATRPNNGRVTVLAYAVGEESFIDLNGNGVADSPAEMRDINGKSTDMSEAFRDDNEDGVFNLATETFIDFLQPPIAPVGFNPPDGKYSGVLCDPIATPSFCAINKSIDVRGSMVIVFSGSNAAITQISPAGTIDLIGCSGGAPFAGAGKTHQVDLRVVDAPDNPAAAIPGGNPMPVGTTIVVTTTNGTLIGPSSFVQINTSVTQAPGTPTWTVNIKDDATVAPGVAPAPATCTDPNTSGIMTVTVTTPGGVITTRNFAVIN